MPWNDNWKAKVARRKKAGLCWRCGDVAYPGKSECLTHLAISRGRNHRAGGRVEYNTGYPVIVGKLPREQVTQISLRVRETVKYLRQFGLSTKDIVLLVHNYGEHDAALHQQ